jgi:hypothetical protein
MCEEVLFWKEANPHIKNCKISAKSENFGRLLAPSGALLGGYLELESSPSTFPKIIYI